MTLASRKPLAARRAYAVAVKTDAAVKAADAAGHAAHQAYLADPTEEMLRARNVVVSEGYFARNRLRESLGL